MKKNKTLKFKLTLAYTIGFLVSLILCFTVIYCVQRHILVKALRAKLNFFVKEFQYEYLAGHEFTSQHNFIDPHLLPAATLQAIKTNYPDFHALSITLNPARRIEILGVRDGQVLRLIFSPNRTRIESVSSVIVDNRPAYMSTEFNEEAYGEGQNQFFFMIFSSDGELLTRSPFHPDFLPKFIQHNLGQIQLAQHPLSGDNANPLGKTAVFHNNSIRVRTLRRTLYDGNVLFIGANLSDFDKNLNRLLIIFGCSLVAMLSVSLNIGYFIASRVSRAINRITTAARQIESGDYTRRVEPAPEGREVNALADAFNDMTDKTEKLVTELKTISENIAHDLRTPLTRMRGKAEVSLFSGADSELAGVVAEECGDMLEMINTMLEITQTEYRIDAIRMTPVDLRHLITRSLDLFSTIAEDKQIALTCSLPDDDVTLICHPSKLQRMIANLLDNALKFTPPRGTVAITLVQNKTDLILTVADTGCGIPLTEQPHIFDRFFRSSVSRTLPGNGLGLSLVRAIVLAHNGAMTFKSAPGKGTTFIITLPRTSN